MTKTKSGTKSGSSSSTNNGNKYYYGISKGTKPINHPK